MVHELSEGARKATEAGAWGFAVLAAGLTLANVALLMSLLAAAISVILGLIHLHDRIKYGPRGQR